MSQREVFDFLQKERKAGNNEYFSISRLYDELNAWSPTGTNPCKRAIFSQIKKLKKYGYIEVKGPGGWPAYFRIKEEYINGR